MLPIPLPSIFFCVTCNGNVQTASLLNYLYTFMFDWIYPTCYFSGIVVIRVDCPAHQSANIEIYFELKNKMDRFHLNVNIKTSEQNVTHS